jgi:hypothetical protein
VINELLLRFEPLRPADTANLIEGTSADLVLERLKGHPLAILSTTAAV